MNTLHQPEILTSNSVIIYHSDGTLRLEAWGAGAQPREAIVLSSHEKQSNQWVPILHFTKDEFDFLVGQYRRIIEIPQISQQADDQSK